MPEGIAYVGPNVIAAAGKELNYLGRHVYAYSGSVAVAGSDVNLIDTTSGSGYIIAKIQMGYGQIDNPDDYEYEIKLNGIDIFAYVVAHSLSATASEPDNVINIIIPPYTHIQLVARNRNDDTSNPQFAILIGKVYK